MLNHVHDIQFCVNCFDADWLMHLDVLETTCVSSNVIEIFGSTRQVYYSCYRMFFSNFISTCK